VSSALTGGTGHMGETGAHLWEP